MHSASVRPLVLFLVLATGAASCFEDLRLAVVDAAVDGTADATAGDPTDVAHAVADLGSDSEVGATRSPQDAGGVEAAMASMDVRADPADAATPLVDAAPPTADTRDFSAPLPAPDMDPPAPLRLGAACSRGSECERGHCFDGVCCDRACTGSCVQCNLAGRLGECSSVPVGNSAPPGRDSCPASDAGACHQDGVCDGQGRCQLSPRACPAVCGNGKIEDGETCDPVSMCLSKQAGCVSDRDTERTPGGNASKCTFVCAETPRICGAPDGVCPSGCSFARDQDCKKAGGASCSSAAECESSSCVDGVCCTQSCSVCQSCGGPGGTCQSIPKGMPDNFPPGACGGGYYCDGGVPPRCLPPACENDQRKCEGDAVLRCGIDRTGFDVERRCSGMQPYCDAGACTGCKEGRGSCGDGLCPESCPGETESVCPIDCGQVTNVRPGSTNLLGDESAGECGPYQAVLRVETGDPLFCTKDDAKFAHGQGTCRVVAFQEATPELMEQGFTYYSACASDEFLVGFGHSGDRAVICCKGPVAHRNCALRTDSACSIGQYAANRFIGPPQWALECCTP